MTQKALSKAQVTSAKELKKNAKKKKRNKKLVKFFIILLIVLLIALVAFILYNKEINYYFNPSNQYTYKDKNTEIKFHSKEFYIKDAFDIISDDQNFIVNFNIYNNHLKNLTEYTDQISYSQSVLNAKNKTSILVLSIYDQNNNLSYCQTNLGDIKSNQELDSNKCKALLDNKDYSLLNFYLPIDNKSSDIFLDAKNNNIKVLPKNKQDFDNSVKLVFGLLFSDINEINNSIKEFREKINSKNIDQNIS